MMKKGSRKAIRAEARDRMKDNIIKEQIGIQRRHETERHNLKEQARDMSPTKKS